jgi:hypothetical protein
MGYLAASKVLEEIVTTLRKKGVTIPANIMNDLKSARTTIDFLRSGASPEESIPKIEGYLGNVEAYLISQTEKSCGSDVADRWLRRLDEARKQTHDEDEKKTRFVRGLPREGKWIRVKPSSQLPVPKLKTMAEESNLKYSVQEDGSLLVFGKGSQIKDFVRKMTTGYRSETSK